MFTNIITNSYLYEEFKKDYLLSNKSVTTNIPSENSDEFKNWKKEIFELYSTI